MYQRFREAINFLRKQRKVLSDGELADIIEVGRSQLSEVLSGKRKFSERYVLKFLNKFPEFNENWLRTGEGEMLNPSSPQTVTATLSAEDGSTTFIGDNNKVNADQTIAMLVAEVAAQRRVTEKVLEQNSELLAMIAANNKR
jgi:hypothetical protein